MTVLHAWTYGFVIGASYERRSLLLYLGPWCVCFSWGV